MAALVVVWCPGSGAHNRQYHHAEVMMTPKKDRRWNLPDREATSEHDFNNRRLWITAIGVGGLIAAAPVVIRLINSENETGAAKVRLSSGRDPSVSLYPVERNSRFVIERKITDRGIVESYNNFYEFGSQKTIAASAQALPIRPWQVRLDGIVEKPQSIDIDDLLKRMPLEERVYRHRSVEAWSFVAPWSVQTDHVRDLAAPVLATRARTTLGVTVAQ
jgi:sulfoxide reductase catalytic subunit YedY